jgi:hypothetical protein
VVRLFTEEEVDDSMNQALQFARWRSHRFGTRSVLRSHVMLRAYSILFESIIDHL